MSALFLHIFFFFKKLIRYGKGKNKALDLPQVGKRHELLEKQVNKSLKCFFISFLSL